MIYPWQHTAWQDMMVLRAALPHALLLHGQAGTGKKDFALHLSQALLCEDQQADGQACGKCVVCGWFSQSNHPDFRLIRPESLAELEGKGAEKSEEKAAKAEADEEGGKKTKAASKEIKVEQIRSLLDFVNIGTHRAGLRVVVVYPLEALNGIAANALLKTLEEPPPNTVFLLVADRTDGILPTILSRCRKFAMPRPSQETALEWLNGQGVEHSAELLAEYGCAPLAALQAGDSEDRATLQMLQEQLAKGPKLDWLKTADALQKTAFPLVLGVVQRWVQDVMACHFAQRVRYFPQHQAQLQRCANAVNVSRLLQLQTTLNGQRRSENHPLAAKLSMETLLINYRQLYVP